MGFGILIHISLLKYLTFEGFLSYAVSGKSAIEVCFIINISGYSCGNFLK